MNRKMPFISNDEMYEQNPKLMNYVQEILFDEVWLDEALSSRERSLITLTVLATLGNKEQLDYHIENAYKNGLKKSELVSLTTHLTFYIGLPFSIQLLNKLIRE